MKNLFPLIILILFTSCISQNEITGTYKSNQADLGFFITELQLRTNDEFKYIFSGDLQRTELTGKYKVLDDHLYLRFNKGKGEIESDNDSLSLVEILSGNYHNYDLKSEHNLPYHLKYKMQGSKLFSYRTDNGKPVRRSKVYTNNPKCFFFGTKWRNSKSYLQKIK